MLARRVTSIGSVRFADARGEGSLTSANSTTVRSDLNNVTPVVSA